MPDDNSTMQCRLSANIVAALVRPKQIGKIFGLVVALTTLFVVVRPARAMDNLTIERLATCQDSWLEWKQSNPAQLKKFADDFQSGFLRKENAPFLRTEIEPDCCWTSNHAGFS